MGENSQGGGYIKLFRKTTKYEWYTDINAVRLYVHLMLTVHYKRTRTLPAGTRNVSTARLAKETGLSERAVRTATQKLIDEGVISVTKKSKKDGNIYKMLNWKEQTLADISDVDKKSTTQEISEEDAERARMLRNV